MKAMSHMYRRAWHAGLKTTYYLRTLGASSIEKATVPAPATTAELVGLAVAPPAVEAPIDPVAARSRRCGPAASARPASDASAGDDDGARVPAAGARPAAGPGCQTVGTGAATGTRAARGAGARARSASRPNVSPIVLHSRIWLIIE